MPSAHLSAGEGRGWASGCSEVQLSALLNEAQLMSPVVWGQAWRRIPAAALVQGVVRGWRLTSMQTIKISWMRFKF